MIFVIGANYYSFAEQFETNMTNAAWNSFRKFGYAMLMVKHCATRRKNNCLLFQKVFASIYVFIVHCSDEIGHSAEKR